MPAPTTTDQLLLNLRKSGLVQEDRLSQVSQRLPDHGPSEFLQQLLDDGLITSFQAERLKAGKYKGFFLGDYVILDQLGGGSTGHVYLAEHSVMHRLAALKVLTISASTDAVARERFFREARATGHLDHPNIIRVHDLRKDGPVHYLIMEYSGGISLHHVVTRHGALPWQVAIAYVAQAATGLQCIHDYNLVHRDIKPANLLLTPEGTIKILDLGLVRMTDAHDSKLTENVEKSILGTADFLAPEQAVSSSSVDIRADLYGLAATLYFLLAGRTMFPDGKTAQKLMWQQLREPTPIRELVPSVPQGLADVIHQTLSKNPGLRPGTPTDFLTAISPWIRERVPLPPSDWIPVPPVRRVASVHIPTMRPSASPNLHDVPAAGSTGTGRHTETPPRGTVGFGSKPDDVAAITGRHVFHDDPSTSSASTPAPSKAVLAGLPAPSNLGMPSPLHLVEAGRAIVVPDRRSLKDGGTPWKLMIGASLVAALFATITALVLVFLLK
jgi:eukaryotic-like serine/threonine-protein kinase